MGAPSCSCPRSWPATAPISGAPRARTAPIPGRGPRPSASRSTPRRVLKAPTPRSPIGGEAVDDLEPAVQVQERRPIRRHRQDYLSRRHFPQRVVYAGRGDLHGRRGRRRGRRDDRGIGLEHCHRARRSTTASARGMAQSMARGRPRSTSRRRRRRQAQRLAVAAEVQAEAAAVGNPSNCASKDGDYIVNCIAAKYASYRRPVSNLDQRKSNMMFLRNRVIEAGICGGLNLGWNLKRGGPELSIDFIAEKRGTDLRLRHRAGLRQLPQRTADVLGRGRARLALQGL